MKEAVIMDIQRYSIHDGPGIRTTVFFKGCGMKCLWCHNPESQNPDPEMMFYRERCIGCRVCNDFCKRGAHRFGAEGHQMDLARCRKCPSMRECSELCPTEALRLCGKNMSAQEVLNAVMADRNFYGEDGGVTCSGGEPLLWDDFLQEFLPMCKNRGISTCLDTTLNVEWERVEHLLNWTDLFLVDVKFMNRENHILYTGVDGDKTIENLQRLAERKKPVIIRMPLLARVHETEEELCARRRLLEKLPNVLRVDCFAVSDHAAAKYRALQRNFVPVQGIADAEAYGKQIAAAHSAKSDCLTGGYDRDMPE